jgi:hypothetical protein
LITTCHVIYSKWSPRPEVTCARSRGDERIGHEDRVVMACPCHSKLVIGSTRAMIDLEPSEVHPNLSTERSHLTLGESSRRLVRTWRDSFDLLRFRIRFQSSRIKKSWFLYGHGEVHRQSTSPSGREQLTCWDQDFTCCCICVRLERDTSSPRSMAT